MSDLIKFSPLLKVLTHYTQLQLKICDLFGTFPFRWNEEKERLEVKEKKYLRKTTAQLAIQWIYTFIMTIYFLSPLGQNRIKSSTRMVGLAFLVCFWATCLMRLAVWFEKPATVKLFNSLLEYEENYLRAEREGDKGDKISKGMMILGTLTSLGLPGFMFTMLLSNPCRAPHLGFLLFRVGDDGCAVPNHLIRVLLVTFDFWIWITCICSACLTTFHIFFCGLRCMGYFLQQVISTFSMETSQPHLRDVNCFSAYLRLRVLASLYNQCFHSLFIPSQIVAAILVVIIGLYTCIKLHSQVPMPGFIFFPLLISDGFAIILVSQFAAKVYTRSRLFVRQAHNRGYRKRAWLGKVAASIAPIKILFGSTNFIDQMAPMVYLNFCFTQTVSLVLLS